MIPADDHRGIRSALREFFYAERVPYGLALMRIFLPLVLLIDALPRWFHVRELYSSDGAPAPMWVSYGISEGLPIPSGPVAVACYTAMIFCLLAASAGWMTRLSLIAATVLYVYFSSLDMVSTLTKYTVLGGHALFLLSLSHCGSLWSVDAALARLRGAAPAAPPRFPIWPQRLIQLLVGVIYLAAAFTKLHTPSFFSGDQLVFWMLTKLTASNPLGERMALYPALAPLSAYVVVIWEVAFVFVAWRGIGRLSMLSIGLVFHALTWSMLGLIVFPLLYCALYLAWLHESDVDRIAAWLSRRRVRAANPSDFAAAPALSPRWGTWCGPAPSAAAFAVVVAAASVAAVEIEHRSDPFGERRAAGRYQLSQLPEQRVAELLRRDTRVRPQDKVFAFDVGTETIGGIVANRRTTFSYGEQAVVQCSLLPPHEDLWVEFNLHDAQGRIVSRHGQFAPREFVRSNYTYRFKEDLAPGDYQWVLRVDGMDVAKRPFRLSPIRTASASE